MSKTAIAKVQKKWTSEAFWREFEPGLQIGDDAFLTGLPLFDADDDTKRALRDLVGLEGYFQLPPQDWQLPIDRMAMLVDKLVKADIPPPFAFAYDEFWAMAVKLTNLVGAVLGPEFSRLPDFWVWHVDPKKGERGWRPHRDKGHMALREDGSTKALTTWLPLTHATTLNGCMYILPADRDPTYGTQNDKNWQVDYPDIRALPAQAGSILAWNQAVLHWGSHGNPRETLPRIAMAFEFQSMDVPPFNQPLMHPRSVPHFPDRLKLIAKQILQYDHMYPLAPDVKAIAEGIIR